MGLTRTEQRTLIAVVVLIAGGFLIQAWRARQAESVVWVEAGDRWVSRTGDAGEGRKPSLPVGGSDPAPETPDAASTPSEAGAVAPGPLNPAPAASASTVAPSDALGIDPNNATVGELELLPGIGPVKAGAIVAYRTDFGNFRSVEELLEVKGIGPKTLEGLRPLVRIGPNPLSSSAAPPASKTTTPAPSRNAEINRFTHNPVNINRASSDELQALDGIGPVLAERIIQSRQNRPFHSVDEVRRVHGIGPKTLAQIRDRIRVR